MTTKLAILLLHGMGDITKSEFESRVSRLREDLNEEIDGKRDNTENLPVIFKPVFYQDTLQDNQNELYTLLNTRELDWKMLRKFLMFSISDAASLEHGAGNDNSVYTQVQTRIYNALHEVYNEGVENVIIIAHSLGGQIISNYIWDSQIANPRQGVWKQRPSDLDDHTEEFLRLRGLRCLLTTGCNIPVFVAGHDNIRAIDTRETEFEWHNFFDEDDVLGWPLKSMGGKFDSSYDMHGISYDEAVTKDHVINAGGSLWSWATKSWNPLSHGEYWNDGDFLEILAEKVNENIASSR